MRKYFYFLLLLALSMPELFDDEPVCRPFMGKSGALFVFDDRDDRVTLRGDVLLRGMEDYVRHLRPRLRNVSFGKNLSTLKNIPAVSMFCIGSSVSTERRDDLSPCVCPRQRGYALVFTVT